MRTGVLRILTGVLEPRPWSGSGLVSATVLSGAGFLRPSLSFSSHLPNACVGEGKDSPVGKAFAVQL